MPLCAYRNPVPADRYGTDVLSGDWRVPARGRATEVPTEVGMVVEEVTTDWCGEVVAVEPHNDTLNPYVPPGAPASGRGPWRSPPTGG